MPLVEGRYALIAENEWQAWVGTLKGLLVASPNLHFFLYLEFSRHVKDKQESLFYICVEVNSSNSLSGFCHPHFLILCEEKYGSCQVNYDCFGFFFTCCRDGSILYHWNCSWGYSWLRIVQAVANVWGTEPKTKLIGKASFFYFPVTAGVLTLIL